MLDYPLIPQETEISSAFVHRVYIEALWLPESVMPLSHLVQSIRRIRDSTRQQAPAEPLRELLKPLLLSLQSVEKKYQEILPTLLRDPQAAMERETIEAEESAMWYAWHHGRPPLRHFPDPDNVDEEKWKKQWMIDMERREVLVQILLHFIYLSLCPSPAESGISPDRSRKRNRKSLHNSPAKRRKPGKDDRSPSPPPLSAQDNLDTLTDRLALWQAIEEDSEKYLKRPGDNGRDWMRVFFEDDVAPLFREQLPDLIKQFEAKIIPPKAEESSEDSDELVPKVGMKPRSKALRQKPMLTAADLDDLPRNTNQQKSTSRSSSRARSMSVEPVDRRSRSRSVSLAAEEIKVVGGKRGGIVGNSRLFASEVEMRRQAPVGTKRVVSGPSHPGLDAEPRRSEVKSKAVKARRVSTTLVAETPPRSLTRREWTGAESDDDIVPDSPELVYLGSRRSTDVVAETPVKSKSGLKR